MHDKLRHVQPFLDVDFRFGASRLDYGPCARR